MDESLIGIKADNLFVDANSLFMRAGFGFASARDRDREEEANDAPAAYTFLKALKNLITDSGCTRVFLCFDTKATFRYEMYPAYKGDRDKGKADPIYQGVMDQLNGFLEIAPYLNCYFCRVPGFEADDILFVLSKVFKNSKNLIVSSDLDLVQCCSENTSWYDQRYQRIVRLEGDILQGRETWTGVPIEFKNQDPNGLSVERFNLVKAISAGDDNIKGLPRYGWKTARKVVEGDHKKTLAEICDEYFDRNLVDPSWSPLELGEIQELNEEGLEAYKLDSKMKGSEIIERNETLMVLAKNPKLGELAKEIQAQISTKGYDIMKFRTYLITTKMNSILININDFLRPFSLLA